MKHSIEVCKLDKENKFAKIKLSSAVYDLPTIYAASYVFLDKAYILLDKDKNNNIEVHLYSKDCSDLEQLAKEFCNELINYAHYFSRVENNSGIIKTIMQRVLFSVNPKFAEEAEEQEIQDLLKELEKDTPTKVNRTNKKNASTSSKK
ncbi:MAG: hypothetical protein AUJ74_06100 [Candidatus Omnitrophica bacterium CG1_02_44_16]|nr:MAG: hypothetical protein AUJ74_06100 [Candidatus Omnitrophica bacterium CG1_02_44_16]PIY83057.1 MAG: hypothetical protein COY78_03715 [Candidatus Omnitrophica bacterium CG_4_10_14_0_8_um_filter_44_12]PIZ83384.1 MAG: hypothetical protein COX96_08135 [Candidatus Omnitrophica bacterium CG_4_10_14_0_2_um_filter_44_9]